MANLRAVEDQEPWRLVDEDTDQHSHPLFRMSPGMKMLGAEEEKESKRYLRRNERFRRNVVQYFQEIIQTTFQSVETYTNPQPRHPMGRRRRAGERTRKPGPRTRLQVVRSECPSERARNKPDQYRYHTKLVEVCKDPRSGCSPVASQGRAQQPHSCAFTRMTAKFFTKKRRSGSTSAPSSTDTK